MVRNILISKEIADDKGIIIYGIIQVVRLVMATIAGDDIAFCTIIA